MKKDAKNNSLAKKPKRKYKRLIFWVMVLLFVICIYEKRRLICNFVDNVKSTMYYSFPRSCQLTEKELENAIWEGMGYELLQWQKVIRGNSASCSRTHVCEIWIIDKKITPDIFDEQLIKFYFSSGYANSEFKIGYYLEFLEYLRKKGKAKIYKGGPINFNQSSVIFDWEEIAIFYDKTSIKLFNNELIVKPLSIGKSRARLAEENINNMLFKNGYHGRTYRYKIDNCGRLLMN
ncbi:hypothetical protein QJU96_07170 [Pasteurella skyensis]|uniref:Uncharacterized protein n=1 Tax=Phocoenobacter skyensis TaxID=97481 RepID=A0AAJ6NEJ0_9PAST|nr:hypothetical protein [Pasteurella skyensis]MDP8171066.1 hypothetical protein [Pasteurella skyensis]MDP8175351.1 hypothetical protein [Pasteurella skyensis]